MFELRIFYSDKYTFFKRKFIGLDDVLSHMGGIFQFITFILNYIVSIYTNNYLYANCLYNTKDFCINNYFNILNKKRSIADNYLVEVRFLYRK